MKSRNTIFSAAVAVLTIAPAFGTDFEYNAAGSHIRIQHAEPTLIVNQGVTPHNVLAGETDVDALTRLTCSSPAGCLVTAKLWVYYTGLFGGSISAYIDNVAMQPTSDDNVAFSGIYAVPKSAIISKGTHYIQTKVTQPIKQGQIVSWNLEYAKYEIPVVQESLRDPATWESVSPLDLTTTMGFGPRVIHRTMR